MQTDEKPSRMMTQDPQEVNAPGNKPSESQPGASADQNLVHGSGDAQQGTTGAPNVLGGNTLSNPVNPQATKPTTTTYATENDSYNQGTPTRQGQEATDQTRSEPPPPRQ